MARAGGVNPVGDGALPTMSTTRNDRPRRSPGGRSHPPARTRLRAAADPGPASATHGSAEDKHPLLSGQQHSLFPRGEHLGPGRTRTLAPPTPPPPQSAIPPPPATPTGKTRKNPHHDVAAAQAATPQVAIGWARPDRAQTRLATSPSAGCCIEGAGSGDDVRRPRWDCPYGCPPGRPQVANEPMVPAASEFTPVSWSRTRARQCRTAPNGASQTGYSAAASRAPAMSLIFWTRRFGLSGMGMKPWCS